MLQELLALRPAALADLPPAVALGATAAGILCWLAGGRFSRSVLTLALVAIGAWVGVRLPRWFGWQIEGMGLGIAGAMLLGFSGYWLHRTWTGVLLGLLLAVWAGAATWAAVAPGVYWSPPRLAWTWDTAALLRQLWGSMPPELSKAMPLAAGCGMISGISAALLWPKLSRILTFDLLGLLLMVTMGLPLAARVAPQWMQYVPTRAEPQVFSLIGLVLLGVLVQWKLTPATPKAVDVGDSQPSPRPGDFTAFIPGTPPQPAPSARQVA